MISFSQLGAGRIGAIHAKNLAGHPGARLQIVVDPDRAAADRLAGPMEQARRRSATKPIRSGFESSAG
jgi:hypothetical protein